MYWGTFLSYINVRRGKMKIITVVGTRPQFIKMALLSRELMDRGIEEVTIHTGQHYDTMMSDSFFRELALPHPKYHLETGGKSHGEMTGHMLIEIEWILLQEHPDYMMVYGDCNSTLAGALSASKLHIPVIHVEAGLRSFDKKMPEEQNRVLTDHLSTILFAPTQYAVDNLAREGITENVHMVGDLMIDLLRSKTSEIEASNILTRLSITPDTPYTLLTIHRQENTTAERLRAILEQLGNGEGNGEENGESENRRDYIFPMHPRTLGVIEKNGLVIPKNVRMIEPVAYIDMMKLAKGAQLIITDSGGLQKEAYQLGTPCLTLRDTTEWIETVENGRNYLIDIDGINQIYQFADDVVECYQPGSHKHIVQQLETLFLLMVT